MNGDAGEGPGGNADGPESLSRLSRLLGAGLDVLAQQGPLSLEDLADQVGASEEEAEILENDELLTKLADDRLASVTALLGSTVLTHRLSAGEAASGVLTLGVDLAPLMALYCCGDHLHLSDGRLAPLDLWDDEALTERGGVGELLGHPGWLGEAIEGSLMGMRLVAVPGEDRQERGAFAELEVLEVGQHDAVPDTFFAQLRASLDTINGGRAMPVPVPVARLLHQLSADAPALVSGALAPLGELLEGAGLEVLDAYVGPAGTDWPAFRRARRAIRAAVAHGMDAEEARGLFLLCELCRQLGSGGQELTMEVAHMIGEGLDDPQRAEAFAEATRNDAGPVMELLAQARSLGGRRSAASLAWVESLVAGRYGDHSRAEACLLAGLAADPDHPGLLGDAAWYASDRGDARQALRYLRRVETDDWDIDRIEILSRYAVGETGHGPRPGRNHPCPCGSRRKFKQCCLGKAPAPTELPERVRWLWEKLLWWVERTGTDAGVLGALVAMNPQLDWTAETPADEHLAVDLEVAESLVLFADGAVEDFLDQRSALLPDDEANLACQWALTQRSLHEVVESRPGEGVSLRDVRTGERVEVRERLGSTGLSAGDYIFAHPVSDGTGYQFVGGITYIPMRLRQQLMALLDAEAGSLELAEMIGDTRRPPDLRNMEGDPTVLCEATYSVPDLAALPRALDSILDREGEEAWARWVEVDGRRWVAGMARLAAGSHEGSRLSLEANSERRFDLLVELVNGAVADLEPLSERRQGPAEILRQARLDPRPDLADRDLPPEVQEALAEFIREHEERWLDEPIPALAGLTPRQAAADPSRREDLAALLHEYERHPAPKGAATYDTARLRGLVGL